MRNTFPVALTASSKALFSSLLLFCTAKNCQARHAPSWLYKEHLEAGVRVCKMSHPNLRSDEGARQETGNGVRVHLREQSQGEMTNDLSSGILRPLGRQSPYFYLNKSRYSQKSEATEEQREKEVSWTNQACRVCSL